MLLTITNEAKSKLEPPNDKKLQKLESLKLYLKL